MDDLIARLRHYGRVEVEEHLIEYAGEWHRIEKGDRYLGKHGDQSPELLTCRRREVQRRSSGRTLGKFFPKERKDSTGNAPRLYTLEEVIKVVIRDNPNYDPTKKEKPNDQPDTTATPDPADGGSPSTGGSERAGTPEGAAQGNVEGVRPAPTAPKPGPRPGQRHGAEHRDPARSGGGRTDYTQHAKSSD